MGTAKGDSRMRLVSGVGIWGETEPSTTSAPMRRSGERLGRGPSSSPTRRRRVSYQRRAATLPTEPSYAIVRDELCRRSVKATPRHPANPCLSTADFPPVFYLILTLLPSKTTRGAR
uniref:Uncharacterized protein n=1 Tax=Plectus sambesii TaxID=2011161 RepID=A0A914X3A4_9BILA